VIHLLLIYIGAINPILGVAPQLYWGDLSEQEVPNDFLPNYFDFSIALITLGRRMMNVH
jgi:hypothetical protein